MTKADLIAAVAKEAKLQYRDSENVVKMIFDMMANALKNNDRIEIRGFGSFKNREYRAYSGRNPKTGEQVHVGAKIAPVFKVGKELKEMVNNKK